SGAGKVATAVSYEDGGKTLVLNVTANFAGNDQIVVSGLQYVSFTAPSASDYLQLVIAGSGGSTVARDGRTITIVQPTIASAANQVFVGGQAATTISPITVTDAAPPSITAANDIRIRIPATLNMTWNTSLTTATITVTDAAPPSITAANDIRIRIPATLNMNWDTGRTTATLAGGAAGKVSTGVSYEDGGKTLVLNVTANFAGADQIVVSGLRFV